VSTAALLDVDGTLVDTNYHHAIAWYRAMRQNGVIVPIWRIHRHIGMGGDQLVAAVAGDEVESESGDAIRDAEKALYMSMIEEVEPLEGARELIAELRDRVDRVVLASSAKRDEVDHYVDLLDAAELADGWTTSADVESTKPQPDLVESAMARAEADDALLIGDTPWDVKAADRAGVRTAAVLTGGFSAAELRDAGAAAVFESIEELRQRLDETPFG
jgi:HAD superfamily hydrolase (TIGR01509 family)